MSKISKDDVEKVASLSRLALSETEINEMQKDMTAILDFVDQINKVNTDGIEPTAHVLDINNISREDISEDSMDREEILKLAPEQADGFIVVPRVI